MVTGYLDNYYARLGIPHTATQEEIRHAYHIAARKFHPDSNPENSSVEVFLQIQEAFDTLSNASARAAYDSRLPKDLSTPKNMLVNTIYSRQTLTKVDRPQLLYVLLAITSAPDPTLTIPTRQPLNVCLVLDNSNSMSGTRMNAVKETATQIIHSLKPEDILSVVAFNDRADLVIPATRNQSINMLTTKVNIINTGGGTEIFQGLDVGYQEIKKNLKPRYKNHIILITDGRTYGDEELCLKLANDAASQGVTIHTIGIGHEWNDDFLDALAATTGGNSEFAETSDAIEKFLKKRFGQIENTVATNVSLDVKLPENVELRYAFRMYPETSSIIVGDTLAFGDLPKDKGMNILMEFLIKSVDDRQELPILDGTLNFLLPSAPIPNVSSRLTFSRPVSENPKPIPPPQILVRAMSRLSLFRLQEMARNDLRAGNLSQATRRLKNLATRLLQSGEDQLAQTVMLELDHIKEHQDMREDIQKQIKYGTRALVLDDIKEESQP